MAAELLSASHSEYHGVAVGVTLGVAVGVDVGVALGDWRLELALASA